MYVFLACGKHNYYRLIVSLGNILTAVDFNSLYNLHQGYIILLFRIKERFTFLLHILILLDFL